MAKSLNIYLEKQERHITFVQVRVPTELVQKTKRIAKSLDKTLSDVVRASLEKFVDDLAPKPQEAAKKQMNFEEMEARSGWN